MKFATLVGNLGTKPTIKTSKGTTYCNFSVGIEDSNRFGEAVTEWYEITAFGRSANQLANAQRGDEISVHGTFHQTTYTGVGGVQYHDIEIRALKLKIFPGNRRSQRSPSPV